MRKMSLADAQYYGDDQIHFKIRNSHREIGFAPHGNHFTASNGIKLISADCPEMWLHRSIVFVQGRMRHCDDIELVATKEEFEMIKEAVDEYNMMYSPRPPILTV